MIFLILAAVGSIHSPAGCRSTGATVYCELAPPAPVSPAASATPARAPRKDLARSKPPQNKLSRVASGRVVKQAPLNEEEIGRHIAALVAIEDCTGARNFANGLGATELARRTFDTCIGLKPEGQAEQTSEAIRRTIADAK